MYEKALAVEPSDADTRSNMGQLRLEAEDPAAAERIWTSILRCSCRPRVADAHQVRACSNVVQCEGRQGMRGVLLGPNALARIDNDVRRKAEDARSTCEHGSTIPLHPT